LATPKYFFASSVSVSKENFGSLKLFKIYKIGIRKCICGFLDQDFIIITGYIIKNPIVLIKASVIG
jgi:hypothetical protein